jgi:hypothetical protein
LDVVAEVDALCPITNDVIWPGLTEVLHESVSI